MKNFRSIFRKIYRFIIVWFVDVLALYFTALILPGFQLESTASTSVNVVAAAAALLMGVINFLIRPLILLLALPFGFILVFLVGLVINAVILRLTASFIPGFEINGWLTAFIGSLIFSAINTILTELLTLDDPDSVYNARVERLAKKDMHFEGFVFTLQSLAFDFGLIPPP